MSGVMCATREKIQLESDYFILLIIKLMCFTHATCTTRHKNGRDDLGEAKKKEKKTAQVARFNFILRLTYFHTPSLHSPNVLDHQTTVYFDGREADENVDENKGEDEDETYNEKWQRRTPKRNSNKIRTK